MWFKWKNDSNFVYASYDDSASAIFKISLQWRELEFSAVISYPAALRQQENVLN